MSMRNVVCIGNLDPENQEWLKERAKKMSEKLGKRVTMSDIYNQALKFFRHHCDDEEALERAKANKEPWLERVQSAN